MTPPPFLSPVSLERACSLLQGGEVVALPTETVYGLAGDIHQEEAVRKIFSVKGRPLIDPLIVHCRDAAMAAGLAVEVDVRFEKLAAAFWPGPLTMIVPKRPEVSDLVTAQLPGVALRVPAGELFQKILQATGLALAAPSANPFGYISPTRAEHVIASFNGSVPVLDGGPCAHGVESTIVSLMEPDRTILLRPGPIAPEAISSILGHAIQTGESLSDTERPLAPGRLLRHYSPRTPLNLIQPGSFQTPTPQKTFARIYCQRPETAIASLENVYWLSETGDLAEMGQNLFALLRRLDSDSYELIECELPPASGLGLTLRDRLHRAAAKR
jgi:L-threonylcarbamoyladenylate synthase